MSPGPVRTVPVVVSIVVGVLKVDETETLVSSSINDESFIGHIIWQQKVLGYSLMILGAIDQSVFGQETMVKGRIRMDYPWR